MVKLEPRNEEERYISFVGGTEEEYLKFTDALGTVESRNFDPAEGKWYCDRVDAVRINDLMNNPHVGDCMKLKPYGYQRQAIAFCIRDGAGLIKLPCGAGKAKHR